MNPTLIRLRRVCVTGAAATLLIAPLGAATTAQGAATPSPSAGDAFVALTPAVKAKLDAAIEKTLRETKVPGAIVGLWAPARAAT